MIKNYVLKALRAKYLNQVALMHFSEVPPEAAEGEKPPESESDSDKEIDEEEDEIPRQITKDEWRAYELISEEILQDAKLEIMPPFNNMQEHFDEKIGEYLVGQPIRMFSQLQEDTEYERNLEEEFRDLLQEMEDNEQDIEQSGIIEFMEDCIRKQEYNFMGFDDFWRIVMSPRFEKYLHIFNADYFYNNPDFFNSGSVRRVIQLAQRGYPVYLKLLRNVNLNKCDTYFDQKSFEQFITSVSAETDPLVLFYFFFHEDQTPIITHSNLQFFLSHLKWIQWGNDTINQYVNNLLHIRFKLLQHKPLQMYLADVFFGSGTYDSAILGLVLNILVLDRIQQHQPILDLLETYKQSFGAERYAFYFEQELPKVLKGYTIQANYQFYRNQLLHTNKANKPQKLTKLDRIFHRSNSVIVGDSTVYYNPNQFNLFNVLQQQDKLSINNLKMSKAIIENDVNYLQRQVADIMNIQPTGPESVLEQAHQYIYKQRLDEENLALARFGDYDQPETEEQLLEEDNIYQEFDAEMHALDAKHESLFVEPPPLAEGEVRRSIGQMRREIYNKQKFKFSTEPKQGGGFLSYLKQAKVIDTEVKLHENEPKAINTEEIRNYKSIFSKDSDNLKQAKDEMKPRKPNVQSIFGKVNVGKPETPQPQRIVQEVKPVVIPELTEHDEMPLDNQELKKRSTAAIQDLIDWSQPLQLNKIKQFFATIPKNDGYHLYCVKEFIGVLKVKVSKPQELFIAIFSDKDQVVDHKQESLRVAYHSQFGEIDKDYIQYLPSTSMPYGLGPHGYNFILRHLQQDFKRSTFKRTLAHLCLYETTVSESTLDLILKLASKYRIPQTLSEFVYLCINRKVELKPQYISKIEQCLIKFKQFEGETENLILTLLQANQSWTIKYSDFSEYVSKCIQRKLQDRYMSLYEQIKDNLLNRKLKQTDAEDYHKLQNEYRNQNKQQVAQFVRELVKELLKNNLYNDARLILNDAKTIRYAFTEPDYNMWMQSHTEMYEESMKIFQDYQKKFPDTLSTEFAVTIMKIVQHSPNASRQFFQDIFKQFIIVGKVPMNDDLILQLALAFRRLKEFSSFQSFLKYLMDLRYPINAAHKATFYRVMNSADDDGMKSSIRGMVDKIVQDKQSTYKKPVEQQSISNAPATRDYQKMDSEPQNEEDDMFESKEAGRGRSRGGRTKFGEIEGDRMIAGTQPDPKGGKLKSK